MNALQKVKLLYERQISWDGLVSLPKSPSASLLQFKKKAKICNTGYLSALMRQWEVQIS